MGKIRDALDAARNRAATRPIPARIGTRLNFLLKREKGSTAALARRLGVSQRSVQRYLKGDRQPSAKVAAKLEAEVRKDWQPRVKARAEAEAARRGVTVETRARFGFRAPAGTTDDGRMRRITQHIPPEYSSEVFAAYRAGATDAELEALIAQGLGHAYFRDGGRRAAGLDVEFTDIDYVEIEY